MARSRAFRSGLVLPQMVRPATPQDPDDVLGEYQGEPVHLSASVTIGAGQGAGVPTVALKNPHDAPMLINEIKFSLFTSDSTAPSGMSVAVKLDLGQIPITNGHVPIGLLCRVDNTVAEYQNSNTFRYFSGIFKWKLARPIFVPPGGVIQPHFQHTSFPGNGNVTARISYGGRAMPVGFRPKRIFIPYAASFVSKNIDVDTADTDASVETQLVNSFTAPVLLDRFISRIAVANPSGTRVQETQRIATGWYDTSELWTAVLVDSLGNPIVKEYTPLYTIVSGTSRSWELGGKVSMPPGSFYMLSLKKDAPTVALGTGHQSQAGFSLIGWREVDS